MRKSRDRKGPDLRRGRPKAARRVTSVTTQPILVGRWPVNSLVFFLLTLATVALYVGDLRIGFLSLDDPGYVTGNPWIREVSMANLRHIFAVPYFVNYSPVHLLSYVLDYALAGPSAFVFHLSSNIWAGVVAGFVFLVALALTRQHTIAIAAAALFVLHPAHVEVIAWISSRKDLVAAAFALPSFLAYLRYRQGRSAAIGWYVASVVLFLFAVAGKMSVGMFPAVLLACDLFIEKRAWARSLIDKVPFLLIASFFALAVASAQPPSGHRPDAYVISAALAQSLWLLTGFGTYVLYRVRPDAGGTLLQIAGVAMTLTLFAAPLLLRRRWPVGAMLAYWILFGLLPAQVLSFSHPVTDRYLFLPSVGATILIASGLIGLGQRLGRRGLILSAAVVVAVAALWGRATLAYVAEWQDVRSVWYGATWKTSDPDARYYLGLRYQDLADGLGNAPRGTAVTEGEARRLASAVWADDPRLPALLEEWSGGNRSGPVEQQFRTHLRTLAWDAYEQRHRTKGTYPIPNLYVHRGVILFDSGDPQGARKEFLAAAEEASRSWYPEEREKLLVESHNALGIVALKTGDHQDALYWLRMADDEQTRFGGNWVPDLKAKRRKLEAMISSMPP